MTRWEEWRVRLGGWWHYHVTARLAAWGARKPVLYCWTDYGNHLSISAANAPAFRCQCTQEAPQCETGRALWAQAKASRVRL